jgi:hypothetical protein
MHADQRAPADVDPSQQGEIAHRMSDSTPTRG